jgi:hypothetical protein
VLPLCSLKHAIHLIEVDVTEQWGDHPALRDATSTVGFQHDLQQVHHVIVDYPVCVSETATDPAGL